MLEHIRIILSALGEYVSLCHIIAIAGIDKLLMQMCVMEGELFGEPHGLRHGVFSHFHLYQVQISIRNCSNCSTYLTNFKAKQVDRFLPLFYR